MVLPVAERAGRLVVLADFEVFLACRAAGMTLVTVWTAEIEPGEDLVKYAIAFATG